jgi:hypothetical protein
VSKRSVKMKEMAERMKAKPTTRARTAPQYQTTYQ